MLTATQKIDVLTNLGIELNLVADLDILMERILTEARRFVNADAGSIYIREGDRLHFTYTQNATLKSRLPPGEKLLYSTYSMPIDENSIAGFAAKTGRTLRIDDVYKLPGSSPYQFGRQFDEASGYRTKAMLAVPLITHQQIVVGVLQVINPKNEQEEVVVFGDEDQKMMTHFASTATVAVERARMTRAIILRMIRMAEMRDPKETGAHVNRVAAYSVELFERWARKRNLPETEIDQKRDTLRMAAMLHDVGKVAISDTILKKPGRLTVKEYDIMKEHTVFGARLFWERQSDFDKAAAEVALNHHEWWNGKGYPGHVDVNTGLPLPGQALEDGRPRGKTGEEIPIFGRIVAITDVYDALCSKRVYKPAWDEGDALKAMIESSGNQFDPELMEIFISSLDTIRSIKTRYPDENETGSDMSPVPPGAI